MENILTNFEVIMGTNIVPVLANINLAKLKKLFWDSVIGHKQPFF